MTDWVFADIGFNTQHELWMLERYGERGELLDWISARSIDIRAGTTYQYGWLDNGRLPNGDPRPNWKGPFWHVRQRARRESVRGIAIDAETANVAIDFVRGKEPESEPPLPLEPEVDAIQVAYSLKTGKGFVELVGGKMAAPQRLENRHIITENLDQRTVGTYPNIRLRTEAADVHGLIISATACVIVGKKIDG